MTGDENTSPPNDIEYINKEPWSRCPPRCDADGSGGAASVVKGAPLVPSRRAFSMLFFLLTMVALQEYSCCNLLG